MGALLLTTRVRYFLAVSREKSFRRAALSCGVTQPSLTNGIKNLEKELGGPLFQRHPRVRLTQLGKQILPHMRRIERAVKAAKGIAAVSGPLDRRQEYTAKEGDGFVARVNNLVEIR
jgi:DNA-binding transcriptional LysR family regulator